MLWKFLLIIGFIIPALYIALKLWKIRTKKLFNRNFSPSEVVSDNIPLPGQLFIRDFRKSKPDVLPSAASVVRVVTWNIERGFKLREVIEQVQLAHTFNFETFTVAKFGTWYNTTARSRYRLYSVWSARHRSRKFLCTFCLIDLCIFYVY